MKFSSRSVEHLVETLTGLPGIGRKSAQRLAFHLLRAPTETVIELSESIRAIKENVKTCTVCGNFTDDDPCLLCQDPKRDQSVLCVVEQAMDVLAVEASGGFHGQYHVLGGAINLLENMGPDDIRAKSLADRVRQGGVREVILATNPNPPGEVTAHFLSEMLRDMDVIVSRIARGIPVGGELEYTDQATLTRALEGRKPVESS